jgi:hypothetical protein
MYLLDKHLRRTVSSRSLHHRSEYMLNLPSVEVGPTPSVTVTAANSSVELTGNFTLAMVDAGPVGTDESKGVTRHWLVNGVTVSSEPRCYSMRQMIY